MTDKPRVLKHSIFGVFALTASVHSFAKAARLRKAPSDKQNRP